MFDIKINNSRNLNDKYTGVEIFKSRQFTLQFNIFWLSYIH